MIEPHVIEEGMWFQNENDEIILKPDKKNAKNNKRFKKTKYKHFTFLVGEDKGMFDIDRIKREIDNLGVSGKLTLTYEEIDKYAFYEGTKTEYPTRELIIR